MSGTIEECWRCNGQYHAHNDIIKGYRVSIGWCDMCNQARLVWEDRAYDDENIDVDTESDIIGKRMYDERNALYNNFPANNDPPIVITLPKADCRCCFNAFKDDKRGIICRKNDSPIGSLISSAVKDGCDDYQYSTVWGFERIGHGTCPDCGSDTNIRKRREHCPECGWSIDRD